MKKNLKRKLKWRHYKRQIEEKKNEIKKEEVAWSKTKMEIKKGKENDDIARGEYFISIRG